MNSASPGSSLDTAPRQVYCDVFFSSRDGLLLYAADYGRRNRQARHRLPVVCLPGLTRNSRDFHRLALFLAHHPDKPRRVVSFDYRGRGRSQWDSDPARYSLLVEAEDIITGLCALGIEEACFIGTSRGALIIHLLAAMRPGALSSVIFNDAGPKIEGAGLVRIRIDLERMGPVPSWSEASRVLAKRYASSFPALGDEDWQHMAHCLYREKDGHIMPDHDPALRTLLADLDLNTPIPTLWKPFDGLCKTPLMVIRGEHSQLLSPASVEEMAARHPALTSVTAAGQGHAPLLHHGDLPEWIADFIARHDAAR